MQVMPTIISKEQNFDFALVNKAFTFAIEAHNGQFRKGAPFLPYIVHPFNVAKEVILYAGINDPQELEKAIIAAVLHDVLEDTEVTFKELRASFGNELATDIQTLSKDPRVVEYGNESRRAGLEENLSRIILAPRRVWCVKLADRSDNLNDFPNFWTREKIRHYLEESTVIANSLKDASPGLYVRLCSRIQNLKVSLGEF